MRTMVTIVCLLTCVTMAQGTEEKDIWAPFRPLVGEWEGTNREGSAQVEAEYRFVLGERFLEAKHKAVFPPDEAKPKGEVHEDRGFISYDHSREAYIFRQFHVEGFVNTYVLDSLASDGKTMIFVSEAIENAPSGTRAKLVISMVSEDALATDFHVAWPEQEFQCYSQNNYRRSLPK